MRAAWYSRNGGVEVLEVGELPTPEPAPGEVLVKLAASGVNPVDVKSRRNRPLGDDPLIVPHSDGAGVIEAVGQGVDKARIGERVWVWNGQYPRHLGTAADYISLNSDQAVRLPDDVGFDVGACIGIPLMTAVQAVRLLGDVRGKTVLVTAPASGVGYYATQLLTRRGGASVIGTVSSPEKARLAQSAGAAHTIDYKREAVADRIIELTAGRGVAGVVDLDFSSTVGLLGTGALTSHGTIVTYGTSTPEFLLPFRALMWESLTIRTFVVFLLTPEDRAKALQEIEALLKDHVLDHHLGPAFPLADIAGAHQAVEDGASGRVIVTL